MSHNRGAARRQLPAPLGPTLPGAYPARHRPLAQLGDGAPRGYDRLWRRVTASEPSGARTCRSGRARTWDESTSALSSSPLELRAGVSVGDGGSSVREVRQSDERIADRERPLSQAFAGARRRIRVLRRLPMWFVWTFTPLAILAPPWADSPLFDGLELVVLGVPVLIFLLVVLLCVFDPLGERPAPSLTTPGTHYARTHRVSGLTGPLPPPRLRREGEAFSGAPLVEWTDHAESGVTTSPPQQRSGEWPSERQSSRG